MVGELQAGDPCWAGPYRLVGRLGAGGMGQVFLGRSGTGALAAVKVIRPDLAGEPGFRERFAREVAAAANVSGRFTALVLDADVESATPWLATAYVPGPSLAEAVATQGALPVSTVLALAAGLAQGLGAIHAAGLVHRDLKPANVLLAGDGPRVIDFGISQSRGASMLTQAGMVVGSPGFMSPEQAAGQNVGPPSDMFSLGSVLAFAATGTHPYGTGTAPMLMYRVVHEEPELTSLPGPVWPLVAWCLARDPAQRPGTGDLLARLGEPRTAPRASRHRAPALASAMAASHPVPARDAGLVSVAVGQVPAELESAGLVYAGTRAARGSAGGMPARLKPAGMPAGTMPAGTMPATMEPAVRSAGRPPARPASSGLPPAVRAPRVHRADAPGGPRARHSLAWAGALAGIVAAAALTVVLLPGVLHGPASGGPRSEFQAGPAPDSSAATPKRAAGPAPRPSTAAPAAPSLAARAASRPASPTSSAPAVPTSPALAASPGVPGPPVPQIVTATTYTVGPLVYVSLTYADPGKDAAGFGFAGVNGSRWAAESHPFTSRPGGFISVGSIAYAFNLGCGLAQREQSSVEAWIYDTAGARSQPVTVTLACAS